MGRTVSQSVSHIHVLKSPHPHPRRMRISLRQQENPTSGTCDKSHPSDPWVTPISAIPHPPRSKTTQAHHISHTLPHSSRFLIYTSAASLSPSLLMRLVYACTPNPVRTDVRHSCNVSFGHLKLSTQPIRTVVFISGPLIITNLCL